MALYLVAAGVVGSSVTPGGAAVESVSRVDETPDLMQSEPQAGLPFEGAPYCGPVAASDSLIYMSKHGYPRLTSASALDARAQGQLSLRLSKLMKTTRLGGTTPDGLMVGLRKYIGERGYVVESLHYQGWEHLDHGVALATLPQLAFVHKGLADDKSAVWLKIGWYRYFPAQDKYVRFAGHWVAVVGTEGDALIVHDPAPRSGSAASHDRVVPTEIVHGKIQTGYEGAKTMDAHGYHKLGGGLKIKQRADFGILDGVVVLRLK